MASEDERRRNDEGFVIKLCIAIEGCFVGGIVYTFAEKKSESDSNFFIHCYHSSFSFTPTLLHIQGSISVPFEISHSFFTVSHHIN